MVDRPDRKRATRSDRLDLVFGALSDPTRRKMLKTLSRGDACVSDLAIGHPISLQAASKHVQALERAGLVRRRREGRNSYLELRVRQLREAADWLDGCESSWSGKLDALEELLAGREPPKARKRHAPAGPNARARPRAAARPSRRP
jgi:DNA-binding transcriptional ArsR family regulator